MAPSVRALTVTNCPVRGKKYVFWGNALICNSRTTLYLLFNDTPRTMFFVDYLFL